MKNIKLGLVPFFLLLLACNKEANTYKSNIKLVDCFGDTIQFLEHPKRVITLCPSQTECALEIIDTSMLVGVTTVCDFPLELIKNKPKINSYPPDFERIVVLKPDVVLSMKGMIKPEEIHKLNELGVKVLVQKSDSLVHIAQNFEQLGLLFGKKNKGDSLASIVRNQLMHKVNKNKTATFLFLFSFDPLYAFGEGNFLNEVFDNNGFKNVASLSKFKVPYPIVSREFIVAAQPDYIFASSSQILNNCKAKYPEMSTLRAFINHQTDTINADICSRPTLRLLQLDKKLKALP